MSDDILNQPPAGGPPEQPQAQTPPAPQAPPVQEPATQPATTRDEKTNTVTFEPTGDSGLDLALEFFGGLGLDFESPELQEAGRGNFSYLEAKLAALGDKAKGGDRYLALAKDAYTRLESNTKASYEARRAVVHEAVGGEENWNSIVEYVKANAEPEEAEQVRGALAQGGLVAKAVAEHLHRLYLGASGTTVEPASPTQNQATAPQGGKPLTLQGYRDEVRALSAKIGSHAMEGSPEYQALRRKYANVTN